MQSWMDGGTLLARAHLTLATTQIHHHPTHTNIHKLPLTLVSQRVFVLSCSQLLSCHPPLLLLVLNNPPNVLIILSDI